MRIHQTDGPSSAVLEDSPMPVLAPGTVLIDVKAAGVSFPDLLLSKGAYQVKPELPFTLGSEGAGTIREASPESSFKPGDRVAFLTLGAYADVAQAGELMTFSLPAELDFEKGAALVINYHTALFALRERGRLRGGETVLVQGAAGGVGTASIQIAKAMNARVIAVVSTAEKAEFAKRAGADDVVVSGEDWLARVRELTGGAGVDVVLDPVGGERFVNNLRSLREGGRLLVVGFAEGSIPEVKVNRLLLRNLDVVGVAWGAYVATRPELAREIGETVNQMVADGHVDPLIGASYPFAQAEQALASLEDRTALGKVVLTLS